MALPSLHSSASSSAFVPFKRLALSIYVCMYLVNKMDSSFYSLSLHHDICSADKRKVAADGGRLMID